MDGFGNHTFRWINDRDEAFFIKYHFIIGQGIKTSFLKEL